MRSIAPVSKLFTFNPHFPRNGIETGLNIMYFLDQYNDSHASRHATVKIEKSTRLYKDLHARLWMKTLPGVCYPLSRGRPIDGPHSLFLSPRRGESCDRPLSDGEYRAGCSLSHEGAGGANPSPGEHPRTVHRLLMKISTEPHAQEVRHRTYSSRSNCIAHPSSLQAFVHSG